MINDVPSAQRVFDGELALAQAYVESNLSEGQHRITSRNASDGYVEEVENSNWYFALAGYRAWGKGNATVCGEQYTLEFEYKFYDRYNWDTGKSVEILGHTVTDEFMGDFHRQGLAKEFDMRGSVKKTVKWRRGQGPIITDGWESEGGR